MRMALELWTYLEVTVSFVASLVMMVTYLEAQFAVCRSSGDDRAQTLCLPGNGLLNGDELRVLQFLSMGAMDTVSSLVVLVCRLRLPWHFLWTSQRFVLFLWRDTSFAAATVLPTASGPTPKGNPARC